MARWIEEEVRTGNNIVGLQSPVSVSSKENNEIREQTDEDTHETISVCVVFVANDLINCGESGYSCASCARLGRF